MNDGIILLCIFIIILSEAFIILKKIIFDKNLKILKIILVFYFMVLITASVFLGIFTLNALFGFFKSDSWDFAIMAAKFYIIAVPLITILKISISVFEIISMLREKKKA